MKDERWQCLFMHRYVVTLDIAKRLKMAGWKKKTGYVWYIDEFSQGKWILGCVDNELKMLSAPIADEILEEFDRRSIEINIREGMFVVTLKTGESVEKYRIVDALAELWIQKNK